MSVYIKGMEMPKNCWECMFEKVASSYADGLYGVCSITDKHIDDGQEDWCPLVPISPHGRLIDADALKQKKKHSTEFAENIVSVAEIDWMPTVIPADKERRCLNGWE